MESLIAISHIFKSQYSLRIATSIFRAIKAGAMVTTLFAEPSKHFFLPSYWVTAIGIELVEVC